MSTSLRAPHTMTVAEFQDWQPPASLADRRWELVDGEPVCMAPTSVDHGLIQGELYALLRNYLRDHRPDCRAIITPGVVPRFRSDTNVRIPDIGVACGPLGPSRILENPLVLAEILSPSNENETRANAWAYTTIPSVHEILLISSTAIDGELYRRDSDGTWPPRPMPLSRGRHLELFSLDRMTLSFQAIYATSSLA